MDGANGTGNRKTIAIEICYSLSGGERFDKAEENAAELIAMLLEEYGWGIEAVKRHYDYAPNKKYCPHRTMDKGWDRFLNMVKSKMSNNEIVAPTNVVNVFYRVKTKKHGWLPEVKNLEDYAGWKNSSIIGFAVKVDKGSVWYQAHVKGGDWLPSVTGYNVDDFENGWAGDDREIDCIRVYYNTPSDIKPYKKIYYSINDYPYQIDDEVDSNGENFAGVYGETATKLKMYIK